MNMELMKRATKKAFDRASKVTGTEADPDLQLYQQLKPEDFTGLMREYGEQGVLDYIRTMEAKRVMRGRK